MNSYESVVAAGPEVWLAMLRSGGNIEPKALEGWEFRGRSLGVGPLFERLTWTTFQKAFVANPRTGRLRGWNVRLEQRGPRAPSVARMRRGVPLTFGHFEVRPTRCYPVPDDVTEGLMLDYSLGGNPTSSGLWALRDPIVTLDANATLLLGRSYVAIGSLWLATPSYFVLERERPIDHVPTALTDRVGTHAP